MLDDSLPFPDFRLINVGWCPSSKIKKVWGVPYLKIEKLSNVLFMFFDRYEIHIQVFVNFINGKLIIFNHQLHQIIFETYTHSLDIKYFLKNEFSIKFQKFKKSWIYQFWASKKWNRDTIIPNWSRKIN